MKIAIVGTAPSSVQEGPYNDPSWTIWVCSRGNTKKIPRVDAWFELHALKRVFSDPNHPDYADYLKTIPTVWFQKAKPDFPNSRAFPKREMLAEFGPYFFYCSFSYMFAAALSSQPHLFDITEPVTHIGLWGVDLAANSEYAHQRPAAHHFLDLAHRKGIDVVLPMSSDLSRPPPLYGYQETSHWGQKVDLRRRELINKLQRAEQEQKRSKITIEQLRGALDNLEYFDRTWSQDEDVSLLQAGVFEAGPAQVPGQANGGGSGDVPGEAAPQLQAEGEGERAGGNGVAPARRRSRRKAVGRDASRAAQG